MASSWVDTNTDSRQTKNDDDIVITLAARTPLCKAHKGGFKDTSLEYMIYALLKQVRERSNLDPRLVEDIALGNVWLSLSFFISLYPPTSLATILCLSDPSFIRPNR